MKKLLIASAALLAVIVGGLVYSLPRDDNGGTPRTVTPGEDPNAPPIARPTRVPTLDEPSRPPPGLPSPTPATPPPEKPPGPGEYVPPPAPPPGPKASDLEPWALKIEQAKDERARDLALHEYITRAAHLDYREQMNARDRLEAIDRKENPDAFPPLAQPGLLQPNPLPDGGIPSQAPSAPVTASPTSPP